MATVKADEAAAGSDSGGTLRLQGFRPWALGIVCLFALGFELGLARQPWAWTLAENTPVGLVAVQDEVVSRLDRAPSVVVVGNSRMIDAVLPRRLEAKLGLEKGAVVNLSIQAARPFDYLSLFQRHGEELSGARLWILGVDDNSFGLDMDSAEQRFRYQADLEQRWRFDGRRRLSYTAGWFVRSLDFGSVARTQLRVALRGRADVELMEDLRIRWTTPKMHGPEEIPRGDLDRIVERNYSHLEISEAQVGFLETLISRCQEAGARTLMVRPPVRDEFLDRVLELESARHAAAQEVYGRLPGPRLLYDRASRAAMEPQDFLDYGHVSESGGMRVTDLVAEPAGDLLSGSEAHASKTH